LKIFLITSVKNACFTYLSSKKHLQSLSESIDNEDIISSNADNPEQLFIYSEVTQRVNLVIATLPMKCQMVFKLIKEEGLSYKEVSKVLEISQNTIETHMRIALRKIRMDLQHFLK
jgi:RNA polymerase sigma-70 factor (ECF subfamily)